MLQCIEHEHGRYSKHAECVELSHNETLQKVLIG
jgi:hypothetical protein